MPDTSIQPTHFQQCLKRLEQDVLRMGALVERSFRYGHAALFERDLEAARTLQALDARIDRYYRQIELDCTSLMTLQAPVSEDLRLVSAFMQLVRDLERIGDYAQDLTELAMKLFPYAPHPCLPEVAGMSDRAQAMLATSLRSLADLDASAGRNVKAMDDAVDEAHDRLYQQLAQSRDIEGVVEPILLLGLIIRHLERMADHATNIGQRVSFIVTGQRG